MQKFLYLKYSWHELRQVCNFACHLIAFKMLKRKKIEFLRVFSKAPSKPFNALTITSTIIATIISLCFHGTVIKDCGFWKVLSAFQHIILPELKSKQSFSKSWLHKKTVGGGGGCLKVLERSRQVDWNVHEAHVEFEKTEKGLMVRFALQLIAHLFQNTTTKWREKTEGQTQASQ